MITFRSNKDDENYLMIARFAFGILILDGLIYDYPENVAEEIFQIYSGIPAIEHEIGHVIDEIAIRKDGILGQYLISHCDYEKIINEDLYIDSNVVKNALLIAIFKKNPIYNQIIPLFQNQVTGSKEELAKTYDEDVLNYILANNKDFDKFSDGQINEVDTEKYNESQVIVYENGYLSDQCFLEKTKVYQKEN